LRPPGARPVFIARTILSAIRTASGTVLTTPAATLPARTTLSITATLSTRATLTGARRASLLKDLLLPGGEDLLELGLRLFLQLGDLLLLVRCQFQSLGHEPGQQVEPAGSPRATGRASGSAVRTAGTGAAVILWRRTCRLVIG
jgi:hypothetical protein